MQSTHLIVAVNRIDQIDCLNIMADDLNHLSPHVLIFFLTYSNSFDFLMFGNEQVIIVTLHLHISFAKFGMIFSLISNPT